MPKAKTGTLNRLLIYNMAYPIGIACRTRRRAFLQNLSGYTF
jgi:hypothetical protein